MIAHFKEALLTWKIRTRKYSLKHLDVEIHKMMRKTIQNRKFMSKSGHPQHILMYNLNNQLGSDSTPNYQRRKNVESKETINIVEIFNEIENKANYLDEKIHNEMNQLKMKKIKRLIGYTILCKKITIKRKRLI